MTCNKPQNCCLCEPAPVRRRDLRGRFVTHPLLGAWKLPAWFWFRHRKKSPNWVEGHLMNMDGTIAKENHTPHLEFCDGCVKRILGSQAAIAMEHIAKEQP